ncbi:MAG: hypothetical protein AABO58_24915 [Acidobacteriota bacterium]
MKLGWSWLLGVLLLGGCATMSGSGPERIEFDSTPAGADVVVNCGAVTVGRGVTPTAVLVERTAPECIATISKDGFTPHQVTLEQGFNRRYWLNIPLMAGVPWAAVLIFQPNDGARAAVGVGLLGIAGMIIDNVTDAKLDHDPKKVAVTLSPKP